MFVTDSWWRKEFRETCDTHGLNASSLPREYSAALRWLQRVLPESRPARCSRCRSLTPSYLCCDSCETSWCRACLALDQWVEFDVAWTCPVCVISEAHAGEKDPSAQVLRSQLEGLAIQAVGTLGARLKPSTWRGYQLCISELIRFMRKFHIVCFPVLSGAHARALTIFFQHLRESGVSWGRMRTYRSAIRSFHHALNVADPFDRFPLLQGFAEGLRKTVSSRSSQKFGLSLSMATTMVRELMARYHQSRTHNRRRALASLRHAVCLILGFWGTRRASEVWVNSNHSMGILQEHVTLIPGSAILLYVQAHKADPYRYGNQVVLCWTTDSGVAIGEIFTTYVRELKASGVLTPKAPFILPVSPGGQFQIPPLGSSHRTAYFVRALVAELYPQIARRPDVLKKYSFHSLRRGSSMSMVHRQIAPPLIRGHGCWNSELGHAGYAQASFAQRLSVTQLL